MKKLTTRQLLTLQLYFSDGAKGVRKLKTNMFAKVVFMRVENKGDGGRGRETGTQTETVKRGESLKSDKKY